MNSVAKLPNTISPTYLKLDLHDIENQSVLVLDDHGVTCHLNKAAAKLLNRSLRTLVWQHISTLLPQIKNELVSQSGQLNPRLRYLARIGHKFQLAMPDGKYLSVQLFITEMEKFGRHYLRLIINPVQPEIAQ